MSLTPALPFMPQMSRLLMHRDAAVFPAWAHPEVRYWALTWTQIRDCLLGDQEIKDKGELYLPRLADQDDLEYGRYLENAVFVNMTARTVNALLGTVFQRVPKIKDLPKKLEEAAQTKIAWNGVSLTSFMTLAVESLIAMGRYGILVDRAADGKGVPFLRGYDPENIIDWQYGWVNGRYQPIQIILREFYEINSRRVGELRKWKIIYRVLSLDVDEVPQDNASGQESVPVYANPVYRQYVYTVNSVSAALNTVEPEVFTPTNRGKTFDFIPFQFLGAKDNTASVDRSPSADIAKLNLAHYRTYAHLEHGRYYCAMPIYYVQVMPHSEKAEYILGPSRVWEVAQGEKPGILEFNGQGLQTLERSLSQKEEQISMLGGRLAGGNARAVSESDNQAKINESNERSTLLKLVQNTEEGFAQVLQWWCAWQDEPNAKPTVDLNAAFIFDNLGARELRAAHMMYEAGIIPITALHNYLLKAELLPEWMDVESFKKLLTDMDEFPNNPDVWAKDMGYANATEMHRIRLERRSLRNEEALTEIEKQRADAEKKDIDGSLDIKQQETDIKDQQAKNQHELAKKMSNRSNGTVPLPGQVGAARGAARSEPKPVGGPKK